MAGSSKPCYFLFYYHITIGIVWMEDAESKSKTVGGGGGRDKQKVHIV